MKLPLIATVATVAAAVSLSLLTTALSQLNKTPSSPSTSPLISYGSEPETDDTNEATPVSTQTSTPEPLSSPSPDSLDKVTGSGHYAAASEEDLDLMIKALAHREEARLEQMEQEGRIFPIYPDQKVRMTGCHGFICSTVTFHYANKADELWTYREALN
jgi:hypothetical protein